MKQILIAVVLFAILVTSVMAEECVPTCNGDQIVIYRVDGRADYFCNVEWSYITVDLMKVLRIKTPDRKRDYPVSNIIYVDLPSDSIPFTKGK